jgi:hypothetical protein
VATHVEDALAAGVGSRGGEQLVDGEWLNGFTLVSDTASEETPVRIVRDSYGAYSVDLHFCAGVEWADRQPQRELMFPMQVHRRVR